MSLVLAGVVLLAGVSTVVAFNGWPGSTARVGDTPAAMLAEAGTPATAERVRAAAPLMVPEAPAPRPARRAARPAARRPASADAPARRVELAPQRSTAGSGAVTGAVRPATATGGDEPASPAAPVRRPAVGTDAVREVGTGLGGALDSTVGDVGTTLDPVSPTLGQTVDDVGQVVNDTVQGVTNTVADVLDGLLQPAG